MRRLRQEMARRDLDAVLVSQPENRRYLSGFDGSAGCLVITASRAVLATDFRYTEQVRTQAPHCELYEMTGHMAAWLPGLIRGLDVRNIGFEADHITHSQHSTVAEALADAAPGLALVATEELVAQLRAVKDAEEIALIEQAAGIADRAFWEVIARLRPGSTERQVAWDLEWTMREMGSQALPFEVIVASGPNGAMAHHQPADRPIGAGEPVVIDMGARVDGYCSDMTRTVCLGPDETYREVYGVVLRAQAAAIAGIREGMSGQAADALARTVIVEAGHGTEFGHSLGHGVGLAMHEGPRLGPGSVDELQPGMVFSIEPGIYISGWGGVRIEDLAVVQDGRLRVLSGAPKMDPEGGEDRA